MKGKKLNGQVESVIAQLGAQRLCVRLNGGEKSSIPDLTLLETLISSASDTQLVKLEGAPALETAFGQRHRQEVSDLSMRRKVISVTERG